MTPDALHNFHVALLAALDAGDQDAVDALCRLRDERNQEAS